MAKGKPRWNPIKCPSCGEPRKLGPLYPPLCQEEKLRLHAAPDWWTSPGWSLRWAKKRKLYWACVKCFRSERALQAKPWLQTFLDWPPRFAYYDIKKRCEDCKNPFIFSGSEQQKWYEEFKFWVQSEPKQCPDCRRLRRKRAETNKALGLALTKLDPKDPLQLARVSELYLAIGSNRKASIFFTRAKNKAGGIEALEALMKK